MDDSSIIRDFYGAGRRAPFVALSAYDNGEFDGFPDRHAAHLKSIDPTISTECISLSTLQSWLFFGTVASFFQQEVDSDRAMQEDEGKRYLCFKQVLELESNWVESHSKKGRSARRDEALRAKEVLWRSAEAMKTYSSRQRDNIEFSLVYASVEALLSRLMCSCSLIESGISSSNYTAVMALARSEIRSLSIELPDLYQQDMLDNGWCHSEISEVSQQFTIPTIASLSKLKRYTKPESHVNCPHGYCTASAIDEATFEPSHAIEGCTCEEMSVGNPAALESLISEGEIPVVECTFVDDGEDIKVTKLELIKATSSTKYVAISHVWSHGLGNLRGNSVYTCQLLSLCKYIKANKPITKWYTRLIYPRRLDPSAEQPRTEKVLFWLDIFCIPVANPTLKLKAIQMMTPVYAFAETVTVFDRELAHLAREDFVDTLLGSGHLSICNWNHRCWTLNEAILGRNLLLAGDGCRFSPSFNVRKRVFQAWTWHDITWFFRLQKSRPKLQGIDMLLLYELIETVNHDPFNVHKSTKLQHSTLLWPALCVFAPRHTTKPEDTEFILASMFGFYAAELNQIQSSHRMKSILRSVGYFPLALLLNIGNADMPSTDWIPRHPNDLALPFGFPLNGTARNLPLAKISAIGLRFPIQSAFCIYIAQFPLHGDLGTQIQFQVCVGDDIYVVSLFCCTRFPYQDQTRVTKPSILLILDLPAKSRKPSARPCLGLAAKICDAQNSGLVLERLGPFSICRLQNSQTLSRGHIETADRIVGRCLRARNQATIEIRLDIATWPRLEHRRPTNTYHRPSNHLYYFLIPVIITLVIAISTISARKNAIVFWVFLTLPFPIYGYIFLFGVTDRARFHEWLSSFAESGGIKQMPMWYRVLSAPDIDISHAISKSSKNAIRKCLAVLVQCWKKESRRFHEGSPTFDEIDTLIYEDSWSTLLDATEGGIPEKTAQV